MERDKKQSQRQTQDANDANRKSECQKENDCGDKERTKEEGEEFASCAPRNEKSEVGCLLPGGRRERGRDDGAATLAHGRKGVAVVEAHAERVLRRGRQRPVGKPERHLVLHSCIHSFIHSWIDGVIDRLISQSNGPFNTEEVKLLSKFSSFSTF